MVGVWTPQQITSRAGTGVETWLRASSPQGDSGERRTPLHLALHLMLPSIPFYLQGRGDCSLLTHPGRN